MFGEQKDRTCGMFENGRDNRCKLFRFEASIISNDNGAGLGNCDYGLCYGDNVEYIDSVITKSDRGSNSRGAEL